MLAVLKFLYAMLPLLGELFAMFKEHPEKFIAVLHDAVSAVKDAKTLDEKYEALKRLQGVHRNG